MLSRSLRILICVATAIVCPHVASAQQQVYGLGVTAPAMVNVGSNIRYTINVTNLAGIELTTVSVSSVFPASLRFVSANPTDRGPFTTNSGMVTFVISQFANGERITFTLDLATSQAGRVTNVVTVSAGQTPPAIATAATTVGQQTGQSDLAVTISRPAGDVFVNDWVPFTLNVVNRGASVSGVFLTNTISPNVIVQGYGPSNIADVTGDPSTGHRVLFNLGTFGASRSTNLFLTLQPTGTNITLVSRLSSAGSADTNLADNVASTDVPVLTPNLGQFTISGRSAQRYNPQNALVEQLVTVSNASPSNAVSARLVLSDFDFKLVNAVGTNDSFPFVVHAAPVPAGREVEMLLEYFIPAREPVEDPEFIAYSAGTISLTPSTNGMGVSITNKWRPPSGLRMMTNLMIEFSAMRGAVYQITYSSNATGPFLKAMPPIVAQASRVQWLDYGPPKTLSRPMRGAIVTTNMIPIATNLVPIATNTVGTNIVIDFMTNVVHTNIFATNMSMRFYQAIELR